MGLYDDMVLQCPETAGLPVLAMGLCEARSGKQFLCIQTHPPGHPDNIGYLHYHPDGTTPAEVAEISQKHGTNRSTAFRHRTRPEVRLPNGQPQERPVGPWVLLDR